MKKLKRALLSAGFVFATMFEKPRLAQKMLITLSQDEFAPADANEARQWKEWHPLERQFAVPSWIGKPRLALKELMRRNLNMMVKKRLEAQGK